ncbi:hypothetical protein PENDEC_c016G02726 [Penicillium decumbens]|uniref:Uncharacterized protein n=1 Tax=Penicillium decumbens TaxID=69771 RepID=A0A1V6P8D5_PENDC|nr:hypothetical protein PENDEC_c016G02726 [Penicillium decumbens]
MATTVGTEASPQHQSTSLDPLDHPQPQPIVAKFRRMETTTQ